MGIAGKRGGLGSGGVTVFVRGGAVAVGKSGFVYQHIGITAKIGVFGAVTGIAENHDFASALRRREKIAPVQHTPVRQTHAFAAFKLSEYRTVANAEGA